MRNSAEKLRESSQSFSASFRGVSSRNVAEKKIGLRELTQNLAEFCQRKFAFENFCSRSEREKRALFLGWSVHSIALPVIWAYTNIAKTILDRCLYDSPHHGVYIKLSPFMGKLPDQLTWRGGGGYSFTPVPAWVKRLFIRTSKTRRPCVLGVGYGVAIVTHSELCIHSGEAALKEASSMLQNR